MTAPYVPGQPGNTPPQPTGPTPAAPKPSFWQTLPGALTIVGICVAVIAVLFLPPMLNRGPSGDDLDVNLTSCKQDSVGVAHVGITVKNNSSRTITARVQLEYRDGAGARLDTDTAYVRNIAPGDTARTEEITSLDAPATSSFTCRVTAVSAS